MKIFFAVILAAIIIGGLVGAEIMDSVFSITGAVAGGIGTAAFLLGLGAFFDSQERKKVKELPPEMREVFDRMLGSKSSVRTKRTTSPKVNRPQTKSDYNQNKSIENTIENLVKQQIDAVARGERVVNRLPEFVRINTLKLNVLEMLQKMDAESIGIDADLYQRLLAINTKQGLGDIAQDLDVICKELPESILTTIETEVRTIDSTKQKPSFDDIELIFMSNKQ